MPDEATETETAEEFGLIDSKEPVLIRIPINV